MKLKKAERNRSVVAVLDNLKFSLNHITGSGEKPEEKASYDTESTKMHGYKWFTQKDMFAPGLSEITMNKKVRGSKKPNLTRVVTYTDASRSLQGLELTWTDVVAEEAEFFDPIGMWEPVKLQLKLKSSKVNKLHWDECHRID